MEEHHLELLEAAEQARLRAYAPYSGYQVGAALRDESGRVHSGCNVENVSFGATICAERSAISRMIAEGGRKILAVVVATQDGGAPCGICLQVLSEFSSDPSHTVVHCVDAAGHARTFKLSELLPHGFASGAVARTNAAQEGSTSTTCA